MKSRNPNANVAITVGGALIAVEQLAQNYLGAHLGPFWSKAIVTAGVYVVLLVGCDGVKGALARLKGVAKSLWAGSKPTASSAP